MPLTVLSVAYPLAPVGPDSVGGAEQVLHVLDRALVEAGHRSIVIACEGSQIAGEHIRVPAANGLLDDASVAAARRRHAHAIRCVLASTPVDLIHMHGIDFHTYLPPPGPPVLATLHLPIAWYPPEALAPRRPLTWMHCVSRSQHEGCAGAPSLLPPIENGVAVPPPAISSGRTRPFALLLARICPEKGIHLAIDAAKVVGLPLLIGGEVFPYEAHRRYFEEEVRPRLDRHRRFLGPVGLTRKKQLLARARCVVIPSTVPETSSLVVREAMAAGVPVVALRRGALAEIIEHGRTGFLVDDPAGLADAMLRAADLDGAACHAVARDRFSLARMVGAYFRTYRQRARVREERVA
jgi:glycosyltransferase involved in cell wall biosynthesis